VIWAHLAEQQIVDELVSEGVLADADRKNVNDFLVSLMTSLSRSFPKRCACFCLCVCVCARAPGCDMRISAIEFVSAVRGRDEKYCVLCVCACEVSRAALVCQI
jgi:hypothetical protein